MSRPLLITDCDEVLLHMVVPFAEWLDEAHHIHFDVDSGDFVNALRHKATGLPGDVDQCRHQQSAPLVLWKGGERKRGDSAWIPAFRR